MYIGLLNSKVARSVRQVVNTMVRVVGKLSQ